MMVYNVKTESKQPSHQRGDQIPQSKVIFLALGASEMSYGVNKQVSFPAHMRKVTESVSRLTL
jgi:hypothetical protein